MTRTDNFSKSSLSARHLPISVKAYRQYCERFRHAFCSVFNMPELYDEAIAVLDKYLDSTSTPGSTAILDLATSLDSGSSPYVALAFHMIKSEIDRSIARSRAARDRAAARKAAKTQSSSQPQPQHQPQSHPQPQPSPQSQHQHLPQHQPTENAPKQSITPTASSSTPITLSSESGIHSAPKPEKSNRHRRSILQRIGKPSPRKLRRRH